MSWVYFIESGRGGPIKIGVANNIEKRMATLQVGNPLPLAVVGRVRGGYELERELHDRFESGRMHFEWFRRDTPGLLWTVEHIARNGELPADDAADTEAMARCAECGWQVEPELAERPGDYCYRCLADAAAQKIPAVEVTRKP